MSSIILFFFYFFYLTFEIVSLYITIINIIYMNTGEIKVTTTVIVDLKTINRYCEANHCKTREEAIQHIVNNQLNNK